MADRGTFPNNATFIANAAMLTSLVVGDTATIAGTVYAWDGTGWEAPWPREDAAPLANEDGSFSFAGPVEITPYSTRPEMRANTGAKFGCEVVLPPASGYPRGAKYRSMLGAVDPRTNPWRRQYSAGPAKMRIAANIVALGQSGAQGAGKDWAGDGNLATPSWIRSLGSLRSDPIPPLSVNGRGGYSASYWTHLDAMLAEAGVDARWANCAVGAMSLINQACGWNDAWYPSNSTRFFSKRASIGGGDLGDKGMFLRKNGNLFQCISGGPARYCFYDSATPFVFPLIGSQTYVSYYVAGSGGASGATEPNWASLTTVGQTIADGALTWELVEIGTTVATGQVAKHTDLHWDPLGIFARTKTTLDAMPNFGGNLASTKRVICYESGQADYLTYGDATSAGYWHDALRNMANWAVAQGYEIALGSTNNNPSSPVGADGKGSAWRQEVIRDTVVAELANASVYKGGGLASYWGINPPVIPESPNTTMTGSRPHMATDSHEESADLWLDALAAKWAL